MDALLAAVISPSPSRDRWTEVPWRLPLPASKLTDETMWQEEAQRRTRFGSSPRNLNPNSNA